MNEKSRVSNDSIKEQVICGSTGRNCQLHILQNMSCHLCLAASLSDVRISTQRNLLVFEVMKPLTKQDEKIRSYFSMAL